MIYRSEITDLDKLFIKGTFSIEKWQRYIENVLPGLGKPVINDSSGYNFEKDILPVINNVYKNQQRIITVERICCDLLKDEDEKIKIKTGRNLQCEIILYLGLCNGAGWVTEHNAKTLILLGIEKILELNLDSPDKLKQLIYHELGHVYQSQYGILNREFEDNADRLLWQLYTEGIAVYFQQHIIGDDSDCYQDFDSWKVGLEKMLPQLKKDFKKDLYLLNDRFTQRYFGDWVSYNGYSDAGYFLGEKFISYLCQDRHFNDVLDLSVEEIKTEYDNFCNI
jgi:hypothetical protein